MSKVRKDNRKEAPRNFEELRMRADYLERQICRLAFDIRNLQLDVARLAQEWNILKARMDYNAKP